MRNGGQPQQFDAVNPRLKEVFIEITQNLVKRYQCYNKKS